MKTHHSAPLIETKFASEIDWQPRRRWTPNRFLWVVCIPFIVIGACTVLVIVAGAAIHG